MNGILIGFFLVSVLLPMALSEARDVAPWMATRLVRWGARRLRSKDAVDRYSEEWLADLEQVPGKIIQLFFACGVIFLAVPRLWWQSRRSERSGAQGSLAAETAPNPFEGWYSDTLNAVVRLDLPQPEAMETRTIVVTADELDQIGATASVPPDPANQDSQSDIEFETVFGVLPAVLQRFSAGSFRFVMALPRVLRRGERHTYATIIRIPRGQRLAPYYIFIPRRRHKHLMVRVRFHPDEQPRHIWKITDLPARAIGDDELTQEPLIPDKAGEVYAEFHDLVPGRRYGIQWQLDT